MATVYEIVQGLSQAAANAYDGALTEDGEAIKASLKREEGDPILDRRVIDGFNVKFMGNILRVTYQGEVQLKEVYANDFESNMEQTFADIVKFLKKEYKSITKNTLSLKKLGECDMLVQNRSRVWTWVQATCDYEIGGLTGVVDDEAQQELADRNFRNLLKRTPQGYGPETP